MDIHNDGQTSVNDASTFVQRVHDAGNSEARVAIWETNTRRHDFSRVNVESSDMIDIFNYAYLHKLDTRVESFCMEKSGHDDGLVEKQHYLGDQGSVFWLPNQTWAQPPHFVHTMIHSVVTEVGWSVLNSSVHHKQRLG